MIALEQDIIALRRENIALELDIIALAREMIALEQENITLESDIIALGQDIFCKFQKVKGLIQIYQLLKSWQIDTAINYSLIW